MGANSFDSGFENVVSIKFPSNHAEGSYRFNSSENGYKFNLKVSGLDNDKFEVTSVTGDLKQISGEYSDAYINIDLFHLIYTYGAELQYVDGTVIEKGSEVPVGSIIKFVPSPFNRENIFWFVTGSVYDTPYAYWNDGTIPKCSVFDQFSSADFKQSRNVASYQYAEIKGYFPINVNKPNVSIDVSKSTARLEYNSDNGTYTVLSPGSISGDVNFSQTDATAYFQYKITDQKYSGVSYYDGDCETFNFHTFPLEKQTINLNAVVVGSGNLAPNKPTFTLTGTCQNLDVNAKITPAAVLDPNIGDTVTYQYIVDFGSGYSPVQNLLTQDFSVIFPTTGSKKISVRAIDQGGLTSEWVENTLNIGNCDSISVYCYDPVFVGASNNVPQYNVKSFSSNTNLTYTYAWTWPFSFSTSPSGDTVTGSTMALGETRNGPSVVMTASNGTSQTINCPSAVIDEGGGNSNETTLTILCKIDNIDDNFIPSWKARASGGNGTYSYTWSGLAGKEDEKGIFIATNPIPDNTTISSLKVSVKDSSGKSSKTISCESIRRGEPKIDLNLSYSPNGLKTKTATVQKDAKAFANTSSNAVSGCLATKTRKGGGTYVSWGERNLLDFGGLSKLVNYPLLTNEVGTFTLAVDCYDANYPNDETKKKQSSATLIVTEIPNFEEI